MVIGAILSMETNLINGEPVRVGNIPNLRPGPGTTSKHETPWTM